jgi:hypothetical protein
MNRWRWIITAYSYSALHIVSWRIFLEGNGHEVWEGPFSLFFGVFFLPLNLLVAGVGRLAWGSLDIFKAHYVFGIVSDFAIASLTCTTIVVALATVLQGRLAARGGDAYS